MESPTIQRMTRSKARQTGTGEKKTSSRTAAEAKERAPLFDVTNSDSPIAGIVPVGKPFPSRLRSTTRWSAAKKGANSPGQDGEELLRSQVRALLGHKSPGVSLPSFHIPADDLPIVHSPCSVTKKAPTPANTPVMSWEASSKETDPLLRAIERMETGTSKDSEDKGSPASITRALRFEVVDSPTALTIRTPIVADRRLKSVVVVPSPDEGERTGVSEDSRKSVSSDLVRSNGQDPSNLGRTFQTMQQHEPQWTSEVQVSSAERYRPIEDADAETQIGASKVNEEAPSQVSDNPLMSRPLALGVFSPVPAPRIAWKRHVAASGKPPIFEDLPVGVLEEAGPKEPEEVSKKLLDEKPPTPRRNAGTFPLLRRALHNDSAKKQKQKKPSPVTPNKYVPLEQFPIPAWYGTPTKQKTEAKPEPAIDEICNEMKSLNVTDGRVSLRGLPLHEGAHVRFDSDGQQESRTMGPSKPKATHTRFE